MKKFVERIYKRNIFSQQIWYKLCLLYQLNSIMYRYNKGTICFGVAVVCLWLLDSLLGMIIIDTNTQLDDIVKYITMYLLGMLKWMRLLLEWLIDVPAGLKLNNQLTGFLSDKLINLLRLWEFFYSVFVIHFLDQIVYYILYMRFMGITITLSLLFDFLKFLNLWLICFYIFSLQVVRMHLSTLRSLFRLFMGRKWNPLRKRVDSCCHDPNQLLLGTLFFISLLFLLPTSFMFFGVILSLRIIQYSIQSIIRLFIVFINRLIVWLINKVHNSYSNAELSTLSFKISMHSDNSEVASIVAILENKEYDLNQTADLLKSYRQDYKNCDSDIISIIEQHSINQWFDTVPF